MAQRKLRAVVIGAGWAGEGHTVALQHCGVEVVSICARNEEVVRAVVARLGVANASTDWRKSLTALKPDIVGLATPAGLRTEVVELAASMGSHILCDKPLATTAGDAERLVRIVEQAVVKHAFAATQIYDPSVVWAAELIANGTIGKLHEVAAIFRFAGSTGLQPWSWSDSLAQGGGALNNGHTHFLGILERITGGQLAAVAGERHVVRSRAPFVPDIHDGRVRRSMPPLTPEDATGLEWRECDAEAGFSALHRFVPSGSLAPEPVRAYIQLEFRASQPGRANGWSFHGENGTLIGEGIFALAISRQAGTELEPLPIPQRLLDALPHVGDDTQSKWVALARDFVADIQGEPHDPYLTFRDGWRYQIAIDAIRQGAGWVQMPG